MDFPPEIQPDFLRERNPDLADLSDPAIVAHYNQYGRVEGREASAGALRELLLQLIPQDAKALEIGPYFSPVLKGPNVKYLDVFTTEELRTLSVEVGGDPDQCPRIDFVGSLGEVDETFDIVFGSHSIEHQPDLVRHLQEVERVLVPGGHYIILCPDKRYCFDHFQSESGITDVVAAYLDKRTRNTAGAVLGQLSMTTHNDCFAHWAGDHGSRPDDEDGLPRLKAAIAYYESRKDTYLDAHAWKFTPENFRRIMQGLRTLDLMTLTTERVYDTPSPRLEFAAILRKPDTP